MLFKRLSSEADPAAVRWDATEGDRIGPAGAWVFDIAHGVSLEGDVVYPDRFHRWVLALGDARPSTQLALRECFGVAEAERLLTTDESEVEISPRLDDLGALRDLLVSERAAALLPRNRKFEVFERIADAAVALAASLPGENPQLRILLRHRLERLLVKADVLATGDERPRILGKFEVALAGIAPPSSDRPEFRDALPPFRGADVTTPNPGSVGTTPGPVMIDLSGTVRSVDALPLVEPVLGAGGPELLVFGATGVAGRLDTLDDGTVVVQLDRHEVAIANWVGLRTGTDGAIRFVELTPGVDRIDVSAEGDASWDADDGDMVLACEVFPRQTPPEATRAGFNAVVELLADPGGPDEVPHHVLDRWNGAAAAWVGVGDLRTAADAYDQAGLAGYAEAARQAANDAEDGA